MRVTDNTFPNSLLNQLNSLTQRQNRLQQQAATGQRITLPEDDPAAMQRVLGLQTEAKSIAQYGDNIALLREQAKLSFDVIKQLKTVSDKASELAVSADGPDSTEDLAAMAKEVTELIKHAVQLANTKSQGDYLFGGTRSDQPPFVITTDNEGNVTGVTYQGNDAVAESEVAEGSMLTAQVPGANAGGSGARGLITDSRYGADFFNHLISLQNHLMSGDTAAIAQTDRAALAEDEDNLVLHLGQNGAVQARLETAAAVATKRGDSLEAMISKEADADITDTLVRLSQTQNAYQAALKSGAMLLDNSLLDYLR